MKYRTRVISTAIVTGTILLYLVLFAEISSYESCRKNCDGHHNDTKLFKDTLSLRDHTKSKTQDQSAVKQNRELENKGVEIEKREINKDDGDHVGEKTSTKTVMHDEAVESLLDALDRISNFGYTRELLRKSNFKEMALDLGKEARLKSKLLLRWGSHEESEEGDDNFVRFHHNIRAGALYDPKDHHIDGLLKDMATDKFQTIEVMKEGTELKLLIRFKKGMKAVFKPMRWGREYETQPDHFYFNDYERHNAEIAAFHLDRVLGFYRVPPVTGRKVDMTKELKRLAGQKFKETFYISPAGNHCFYGYCDYYCDSEHPFCGKDDIIEGSIMAWLPDGDDADRDRWFSPYRRSYSKSRTAEWETNENYCKTLTKNQPYLYKRFMADFIDSQVFDFLTGNMDRHHVEVFRYLRNDSCPIHLDNGRAFGKWRTDEFSIIAPLRQCCQIRKSTFLKLAKLYIGPERLSDVFDESMKSDPVYPVVFEGHLNAVDRRVLHILKIVAGCVQQAKSVHKVIINDPY